MWMRAANLSTLLALLLLTGIPVEAATAPLGESFAALTYSQSATIDGTIRGELSVQRIIMDDPSRESLVLRDAVAQLLLVTTAVNHTDVAGTPPLVGPERPHQTLEWADLPPGNITIRWQDDSASVAVFRGSGYLDGEEATIDVGLSATRMEIAPAMTHDDGVAHYWPDPARPGEYSGGVSSDARQVRAKGDVEGQVTGAMVVHLRQAIISVDGETHVRMEPFSRTEYTGGGPVLGTSRGTTTVTEGFLIVDSGTLDIPLQGKPMAMRHGHFLVQGDVVYNGASGSYRLGQTNGSFARETVGISGDFRLNDRVAEHASGSNARGERAATTTGSFSVIAVDSIVQAAAPAGPSLLEQALWATVLFGMLGLLAWALQHGFIALYSRIREDAVLEHPKRAEIMQFVEENPGCHVLRVAEDLGLARGVARHHLMVLERAGRLRRFRDSGQTLLVPAYQTKDDALRAAACEDPHLGAIRALVAQGGMRRAELVALLRDRFGVADPTARRWIEKAVKVGLIEESGRGHGVVYRHAS